MKKLYSMYLDTDLIDKLDKIAEKENRSRSNLIETLIRDEVNTYDW